MARYISPRWWNQGSWRFFGDESSTRSECWAIWREEEGTWTADPPKSPADWGYPNFPDLETAKAWVEIEASNHG